MEHLEGARGTRLAHTVYPRGAMSSDELTYTPAWRLAELVRTRRISPVELTAHFLERAEAHNPQLNAYITVAADQAMEAARTAEAAVASGEELGPLHGVPVAIKDLNVTRGIRTTRGSPLFKDWVPEEDDIPVERIRAAGAIILGKTNTPEFGWKGTTENPLTDPCRNPWDRARTSGGSSGGAGSALAAGLCPLANGSDAGGSIRIPASFCGVYGMKPTAGRVPISYQGPGGWQSISQNGPMTNNVRDAALLLTTLAGPDPRDALCIQESPPDFLAALESPTLQGLRVAWSPTLGGCPVDPEVQRVTARAVQELGELGAEVEEQAPDIDPERMVRVWSVLALTDLAINLGPMLKDHGQMLTPALLNWVTQASTWPATHYSMALRDLEWHRRRTERFFQEYDLLLTPTMAVPAFPIDEPPEVIDGQPVDSRWGFTPFCSPFNLSGHPAASIPCGFTTEGLPVGLQIVGPKGADATVLSASAAYEAAHPWDARRPSLRRPAQTPGD